MAKQQILIILTPIHNIRVEPLNWILLVDGMEPHNYIPSFFYEYKDVATAIGDGWRLLSPPIYHENYNKGSGYWKWWLERLN